MSQGYRLAAAELANHQDKIVSCRLNANTSAGIGSINMDREWDVQDGCDIGIGTKRQRIAVWRQQDLINTSRPCDQMTTQQSEAFGFIQTRMCTIRVEY